MENKSAILITINQSYGEMTNYEATRKRWVIDRDKASNYKFAVAVAQGKIIEVYKVDKWNEDEKRPGRSTFDGIEAELEIRTDFIGRSVDPKYLGGQNPIRYVDNIDEVVN